jgi:hypothetical protein
MTHSAAAAPDEAYALGHPAAQAFDDDARMRRVHWCLRLGAAACFVGHGAFGVITKAAWVPYFAVAGIPSDMAYALMPVVGTVDVLMGLAVLVSPRPFMLLYMAVWALWTALLRPLAGEPLFETMERAGNYGVPFAMLLLLGWPRSWRGWVRGGDGVPASRAAIARMLQWTTGVLLSAHGALAAFTGKTLFATHYAALGVPAGVAPVVGWAEMIVSALVMVFPTPALALAIAIWKVATEALFPISGAPIWDLIERGGSYAAPLALALLPMHRSVTTHIRRRLT